MSYQDPIADMLVRIMNAQARLKRDVSMPSSLQKTAIAAILKQEGYVNDFRVHEDGVKRTLQIELRYYEGKPVIEFLKRVSRPGLRRYRSTGELPKVLNGLGTAIISTSKGIMTDKAARKQGIGGEIICLVA